MNVGSHASIRITERRRNWRWLWLRHRGITVRGYIESWQVDSRGRAVIELDRNLLERMRVKA